MDNEASRGTVSTGLYRAQASIPPAGVYPPDLNMRLFVQHGLEKPKTGNHQDVHQQENGKYMVAHRNNRVL